MSFYFETLRQSDAWMDILIWFQLDVASFSKWDFLKTSVFVRLFLFYRNPEIMFRIQ